MDLSQGLSRSALTPALALLPFRALINPSVTRDHHNSLVGVLNIAQKYKRVEVS